MAVKEINKAEFEKSVGIDKVSLVDFYADWCGPCKTLKPVLEEVSEEGVTVYSVNVDNDKELAQEHQISSIPAVFVFKGGKKVDEFVGVKDKEEIMEIVKKHS